MTDQEMIFKECTAVSNKINQEYWLTNKTFLGVVFDKKIKIEVLKEQIIPVKLNLLNRIILKIKLI